MIFKDDLDLVMVGAIQAFNKFLCKMMHFFFFFSEIEVNETVVLPGADREVGEKSTGMYAY